MVSPSNHERPFDRLRANGRASGGLRYAAPTLQLCHCEYLHYVIASAFIQWGRLADVGRPINSVPRNDMYSDVVVVRCIANAAELLYNNGNGAEDGGMGD